MAEVCIDTAADDPFANLLPMGEAFSLPERLLGHAGNAEVLVSPQVARRIEASCDLESRQVQLGPSESDRRTVYAVLHPRARAEGEAAAGLVLTPFVGRDREIDLLMDAFERAESGHGQVVFVAGDAGIGKSRLLAEFRHRLEDRPHRWIEGRCASYGATTPFLPIIDGMRREWKIDDRDGDVSASAKVTREVEQMGADFAWTLPYVRQLLSLEVGDASVRALDSASRRSELFRALRALMLRAAEPQPLIIAIEDLHWIDPASEEYLAFVEDAIPTVRVLLLLSHRTGYRQPFGDRSYHQRVTLRPLSSPEMTSMAGSILGAFEVPEDVRALIGEKAEGNPFFVEELTRSLLE
jgi:predicted ATPase